MFFYSFLHLEVVELATDFFPIHLRVVYFKMWLSEVFDTCVW